MIKKIFCFGLGLAGLLLDKFDELACAGEERLAAVKNNNSTGEVNMAQPAQVDFVQMVPDLAREDDLTIIKGIGPTFAKRLKEAGITTYEELAALSAEQLREITQTAGWQADPNEWILQAKAVA